MALITLKRCWPISNYESTMSQIYPTGSFKLAIGLRGGRTTSCLSTFSNSIFGRVVDPIAPTKWTKSDCSINVSKGIIETDGEASNNTVRHHNTFYKNMRQT